MSYVVIDVGCIECGEQTYHVGTFITEENAVNVAKRIAQDRGVNTDRRDGTLIDQPGVTYYRGSGWAIYVFKSDSGHKQYDAVIEAVLHG